MLTKALLCIYILLPSFPPSPPSLQNWPSSPSASTAGLKHSTSSTKENITHLPPSLPSLPSLPQDLAIRLLPFRVDGGAQAFNLVKEGEEIDWVALAKGRHNYKERLERGEVTALSPSLESSVLASAAA